MSIVGMGTKALDTVSHRPGLLRTAGRRVRSTSTMPSSVNKEGIDEHVVRNGLDRRRV